MRAKINSVMKKQQDDGSVITAFIAIVVAIIAITVFLYPMPVWAPYVELTPIIKTVDAKEVINKQVTNYDELATKIIQCESSGMNVQIIDSNGKWSRGIAQFQDETWGWMSKKAGIAGSPLDRVKAREVLLWALKNGYGRHWTCYKIVTR